MVVFQELGLRTLRMILDSAYDFWETAASVTSATIQHERNGTFVPKTEFEKLYHVTLTKTLQICNEEVGLTVMGRNNGLPPTVFYDETQYPQHLEFVLTPQSDPKVIFRSSHLQSEKKVREAVKRWYGAICLSPDELEIQAEEKQQEAVTFTIQTSHLQKRQVRDAVTSWCANTNLPTSPPVTIPEPHEMFRVDSAKSLTKKISKKTLAEKIAFLDLYKEAVQGIRSLPLLSDLSDSTQFIGRLVLHVDSELAKLCSHALQDIVIDWPSHRSEIVQGFLSLLLQQDYQESSSLYTLLSQLLIVLDLWIERSHVSDVDKDDRFDASQLVIQVLSFRSHLQTEAVALINLCHPEARVRILCLNLLNVISVSAYPEGQTSTASVLERCGVSIVQRARYQFLLNSAGGIQGDVKLVRFSFGSLTLVTQSCVAFH